MSGLTDRQQAIATHPGGTKLVAASAGSGKTRVLIARCLHLLTHPEQPRSIDQLLIITFTRAAAGELRERLAGAIAAQTSQAATATLRRHLGRQLALLPGASIGTFDAWCHRLVREHFEACGIDPAFAILPAHEQYMLETRAYRDVRRQLFRENGPTAAALQSWLKRLPRPADDPLGPALRSIRSRRETLLEPERWFEQQREALCGDEAALIAAAQRDCALWLAQDAAELHEEIDGLLPLIQSAAIQTEWLELRELLERAARLRSQPGDVSRCVEAFAAYKFRRATKLEPSDRARRNYIKDRFRGLKSVNNLEHYLEDASVCGPVLRAVLDLESRWQARVDQLKAERRCYSFADIQRRALRLLSGADGTGVTAVAEALRRRYDEILVDEFQDTSPIQVEITRLIERNNRFLVGDVKQSIYAFRGAEPSLFRELADQYRANPSAGEVLLLTENFRSHPDLVHAVNALFARLFDRSLGGVEFHEEAHLTPRRGEAPNPTLDGAARVTLHTLQDSQPSRDDENHETDADALEATATEREALAAAALIREMLDGGVLIPKIAPDGRVGLRPLQLDDIVILLRAAQHKAGLVARTLRRLQIPAVAIGRESLLDELEVQDALGVLTLLVNRRDDVALAAYLRGPLVGLSDRDLLEIAHQRVDGPLLAGVEALLAGPDSPLQERLVRALQRLERWRELARERDVATVLRQIVAESELEFFALAQRGGPARAAALAGLIRFAEELTGGGRMDLCGFVSLLHELDDQDAAPEFAAPTPSGCVRVMTIHASKGLEFPVVLVLDAGRQMGRSRRDGCVTADSQLGLGLRHFCCERMRTVETVQSAAAARRQRERTLDEELRLLYVAATRAREKLVVIGHGPRADKTPSWIGAVDGPVVPLAWRRSARSTLDWLQMSIAGLDCGALKVESKFDDADAYDTLTLDAPSPQQPAAALAESELRWVAHSAAQLQATVDLSTSQEPAILSVSTMKRLAMANLPDEDGPGAAPLPAVSDEPALSDLLEHEGPGPSDGRSVGVATHRFLERADFMNLTSAAAVRAQCDRLVAQQWLTPEMVALLSVEQLAWLGRSPIGEQIRAATNGPHSQVLRELPFTLALRVGERSGPRLLRGVIDCLVVTPEQVLLIDYKTDVIRNETQLELRRAGYTVQLALYARAAATLLGRPVTGVWLAWLDSRTMEDLTERVEPAAEQSWSTAALTGSRDCEQG